MHLANETPVLLQLLVTGALPGCAYALQLGARDLDQIQIGDGTDLLFRFSLASATVAAAKRCLAVRSCRAAATTASSTSAAAPAPDRRVRHGRGA